MSITVMRQALEGKSLYDFTGSITDIDKCIIHRFDLIQAIKAIATEESSATQKPVAWNGKPLTWKLVPVVPTQAMLDEMNLTGREGYDEVMGDGFSASLYGAALIAAPAQPKAEQTSCYCPNCEVLSKKLAKQEPKREWVGLNWDDLPEIYVGDTAFLHGAKWAEAKLNEKNT